MIPSFTPTSVGSLPHIDPAAACQLIQQFLPEIPAWPQLPITTPPAARAQARNGTAASP